MICGIQLMSELLRSIDILGYAMILAGGPSSVQLYRDREESRRCTAMAHHAVPALIHTRPIRPIVARGRHQLSASESGVCTDSDSTPNPVKVSHRSLWCCFFLIMPFAIPILIYVKDSDVMRRVFLGIFTTVIIIILVCFSVAVFHNRTEHAVLTRHNSDDDRLRYNTGMSTPRRLLSNRTPTISSAPTNSRSAEDQRARHPLHLALSPVHHSHSISICSRSGPSSSDSLEIMKSQADDPPPYHVALSLPLPEVHGVSIAEPVETPPPAYDKVLG